MSRAGLHRVALAAVGATLLMISIGALVTSRDAGLSIPDPVTNHGGVVPIQQIREGYAADGGREYSGSDVLSEWAHRVVGWSLGILILGLAVLLWRSEPRAWVRKLGCAAVGLVALQGAVGALGVQLRQPAWMVIPHSFLAQSLLALLVAIAYATSREAAGDAPRRAIAGAKTIVAGAGALAILTFAQLVLGAAFRHANSQAALGAHLALALLLVVMTAWLATRAQSWHSPDPALARAVTLQGGLLMLQLFLGFLAWLFRKPKNTSDARGLETVLFPTLHVLVGACLLAGFVLLWLRARRLLAERGEISARDGRPEAILAAP